METVNYQTHFISVDAPAREALRLLDQLPDNEIRILFVMDRQHMVGTLTDGDIRRGLLADLEISQSVSHYMNRNFRSLRKGDISPAILANFRRQEIWFLPVLNDDHSVDGVINLKTTRTVLPATALIMAGGRGERLRPLTDAVPKPMLKVGDTPIIELNIDRLKRFGIRKFYISVKYLSQSIVDHFGDGSSKGISIEYLHETDPLGTLGCASLISSLEHEHLLVMNADILTNVDFEDFFNFYQSSEANMCGASIPYKVNIPYGILRTEADHTVAGLEEKPTYTYYANAGIYLINKQLISSIPTGTVYNATDLMEQVISTGGKLVHYPILQYWLDIGKYEDYARAQQDYKHISF